MAEYIERKAVLEKIESSDMWARSFGELYEVVKDMPDADVAPARHGRWEKQSGLYSCSECGMTCPYDVQADVIEYWACNYCPSCGATMDLEAPV